MFWKTNRELPYLEAALRHLFARIGPPPEIGTAHFIIRPYWLKAADAESQRRSFR
jgi:hypothetical protein